MFQLTGQLFGCRPASQGPDIADAYTGYWADDARRIGEIITVGEAVATSGAFLLRTPEAGVMGHIVVSQGNGKTVEAHSTARGVIESRADGRRWHVGVLVPGIDVQRGVPTPPHRPTLVLRVTKPPMSGEIVRSVQRVLRERGFHAGPIDGAYGPQTAAAVQAFQAANGLVADGEAGAATAGALGIEWPT